MAAKTSVRERRVLRFPQRRPNSAHYNQVSLGANYALSTRTDLYALAGYQKASGNTLNANGKVVSAQASIGDYGVSSGTNSQEVAVVGIRHKF